MENETFSPNGQKGESLTPKELFKKHLRDPNHHVTDEELMNLKVGADAEDETKISVESKNRKSEVENLSDSDTLPNPYNVVK